MAHATLHILICIMAAKLSKAVLLLFQYYYSITLLDLNCFYSGIVTVLLSMWRYAVAEWYEAGLCDREVAGSTPARGCCVPTPTQRASSPGSVNE